MDVRNAKGYMKPELLDRIVSKAKAECRNLDVGLYNWTEPFIHPNLAEMIRIVRSKDVSCSLSSNLNIIKRIDDVLSANPKELRVSLSGFSQDSYGVTHKRGDIETVKKNMIEVARAKERTGSSTRLYVLFHRYLGNHGEETSTREFAESLGYEFEPVWAYLMPLEKVLAFTGSAAADVPLTDEDREIIDRLALPLNQALEESKRHRSMPCELRDRKMAITVTGDVMLCCTTYDQSKYSLGSYLDHSLEELQAMKNRHWLCGHCMENGIHVLSVYGADEFDNIALSHVAKHYPDAKLGRTTKQSTGKRKVKSRVARKALKTYRKFRGYFGSTDMRSNRLR
jgi:MoaA/NifB/PqqE/SkfB family radical SAM enzyme